MTSFCSLNTSSSNVTVTTFSSSLMTSIFCLVTASSHVSIENGTSLFDLLGDDPYYPAIARDNRFSRVPFSPYYRDSTNCISVPKSTSEFNVTINETSVPSNVYGLLFYVDSSGISKYSKQGFLCQEGTTELSKPNKTALSTALTRFKNEAKSPTVKLSMYPYLFRHYGYEAVLDEANVTYFKNPPLDKRSPKDLTRRGGLNNKCAEDACSGDQFKAHNGGKMVFIHDVGYQAELLDSIVELAKTNLAKETDP